MKKLLGVLLVAVLGAALLTGCSQTSSSGGTTNLPASTVASDLGTMTKNSLALDNGILGVISAAGAAGAQAMTASTPSYGSDSWWSSTDSYSGSGITYDITYKWRVWDTNGSEITTLSGLQAINSSLDISALWTYTSIAYTFSGGSYSISYGSSTSAPLKWSGYNTTSHTISGPITFSSTYQGSSYSGTYTFNNLTLTSGYPSGQVAFSFSESGTETVAGSITFSGTNTATITFTSGLTGTYTVNLDTGAVS